eukprot:TRINITY_DN24527_c0_g1_i3.p1 TRINITY_DN24527_c0_g1~~TRINITY_DN24527_c0_g1_i3.p1  ORF type:complete len:236 (-),score=31.33 TRINITY_DN24527_c0_g1_i3:552-1259(-)
MSGAARFGGRSPAKFNPTARSDLTPSPSDEPRQIMCGILHKRKSLTLWKERMFRLWSDGALRYYETPTSTEPKNTIPVETMHRIEISKDRRYWYIKTNKNSWKLWSPEATSSIRWAEALQSIHSAGKLGLPVVFDVKTAEEAAHMSQELEAAHKTRTKGQQAWNEYAARSGEEPAPPEEEAVHEPEPAPLRRISRTGEAEIQSYMQRWGDRPESRMAVSPAQRIKADMNMRRSSD